MRVFISGQKYFGAQVLRACLDLKLDVCAVCCPLDDTYVRPLAARNNISVLPSGLLSRDVIPDGVDLGISAHSFDYVSRPVRYAARHGWIGYHPSLLPRHRGRSAIEWAVRMRDPITGGTVFWLNSGVDRGDIERQDWVWIDPGHFAGDSKKAAAEIWRSDLLPLGERLMREALSDISNGVFNRRPQDKRFSTFEPSTNVKDIFRPDMLMIGPGTEPHARRY